MYIKPISDSSSYYDITISADGNIAFPEDSTSLLSFGRPHSGGGYFGALRKIEFNNSIDTSNVKNMSKMFWYNNELKTLDLSSFDTSNVTNMSWMFGNITSFSGKRLREIKGLNKFDTSKVTDMSAMFFDSAATSLDLSSFDTSKVTSTTEMFTYSTNLKTIYASDKFNINGSADADAIFSNCTSLVGGAGTVYDSTKIDKTYARIDGGSSNPGYFTKK